MQIWTPDLQLQRYGGASKASHDPVMQAQMIMSRLESFTVALKLRCLERACCRVEPESVLASPQSILQCGTLR